MCRQNSYVLGSGKDRQNYLCRMCRQKQPRDQGQLSKLGQFKSKFKNKFKEFPQQESQKLFRNKLTRLNNKENNKNLPPFSLFISDNKKTTLIK